jgi:hypothetical protein
MVRVNICCQRLRARWRPARTESERESQKIVHGIGLEVTALLTALEIP